MEYTLGNGVNFGLITREQAAAYYEDLTVDTNEFGETELVFRHADVARAFAETALQCSKIYISDADRYAMQLLAELLRDAIAAEVLTEGDLWLDEPAVIGKLRRSHLSRDWEAFCGLSRIMRADAPGSEGRWRCIHAKRRCIDPYIYGTGRVSACFPEFSRALDAFRNFSPDYWLNAK